MAGRTCHGVRLEFNPKTRTWDGEGASIGRCRATEYCQSPHPWRWRDENTGAIRSAYCRGDEVHDREIGWSIEGGPSGLIDDVYETLDEAWRELARVLKTSREKPFPEG